MHAVSGSGGSCTAVVSEITRWTRCSDIEQTEKPYDLQPHGPGCLDDALELKGGAVPQNCCHSVHDGMDAPFAHTETHEKIPNNTAKD